MNTLILEIGNYGIRAACYDGHHTTLIPMGSYHNPFVLPSICTKLPDGKIVWGDVAKFWRGHDGCLSYSLMYLEKQPMYIDAISSLIAQILSYVSDVTSITYVIPASWHIEEPLKEYLKKSANKNKITTIKFISLPIAVCYKAANLENKEYALFYDAGYKGTTISLLQRQGNRIHLIDSISLAEGGGLYYDRLLLEKIQDAYLHSIEDMTFLTLYSAQLEEKTICMKERLSVECECQIPVDGGARVYKMNTLDLHTLIAPALGKTFQTCDQILQDNHVKKELLRKVYLFGGSSRIPDLQKDLTSYLKAQLNDNMHVISLLKANKDDQFLSLLGASIMETNDTDVVIKFS